MLTLLKQNVTTRSVAGISTVTKRQSQRSEKPREPPGFEERLCYRSHVKKSCFSTRFVILRSLKWNLHQVESTRKNINIGDIHQVAVTAIHRQKERKVKENTNVGPDQDLGLQSLEDLHGLKEKK